MSNNAAHRPVKQVPTATSERSHSRRIRVRDELRKDARAKLVSAKRAKPSEAELELLDEHSTIDHCIHALDKASDVRLKALKALRQQLEKNPTPNVIAPITKVITADDADPVVAEEAIWCLNVLAHGYDAIALVDAAPLLLHRLVNRLPGMKAATWTIANLAADNPGTRRRLRQLGSVDIVLTVLQKAKSVEMARIAAWALCNLIRGQNDPDELKLIVESRLPTVVVGLAKDTLADSRFQVLAELLWICTYLTAGDVVHSAFLLERGLGSVLAATMRIRASSDGERSVKDARLAALRCIGNIVSGPDELCDALLELDEFLPELGHCLSDDNPALVKEAMWAIANICGGSPAHSVAVMSANLLSKIVYLFRHGTFDVKKEAGFALFNLARVEIFFERVWNCQVLDVFLSLMKIHDSEAAELGFKFVKLALQSVPGDGAVQALKNNDGQAILEDLRLVREDLQQEANALIDMYLDTEEDYDLDANDMEQSKPAATDYPPWRLGAQQLNSNNM